MPITYEGMKLFQSMTAQTATEVLQEAIKSGEGLLSGILPAMLPSSESVPLLTKSAVNQDGETGRTTTYRHDISPDPTSWQNLPLGDVWAELRYEKPSPERTGNLSGKILEMKVKAVVTGISLGGETPDSYNPLGNLFAYLEKEGFRFYREKTDQEPKIE